MNSDTLRIDFVIVTYNSTDYLLRCLNSLQKNNSNLIANRYIINNNEMDDIEIITHIYPNTIVIQNENNIGFSKAVNLALKRSDAPFICILNPDTLVSEEFVDESLAYMMTHSNVGVMGPKIFDDDGHVQGSARSFPTLMTAFFGRTSWLTKIYPRNSLSKKNISNIEHTGKEPIEVDWVSGACMILRRKAVEDVGDMDERFFMYWEDADLCRRMWKKVWKVIYYPKASISHICGQSSKTRPLHSMYHFHKSCYQLYEKYTPRYKIILLPIVLLVLSIRLSLLTIIMKLKYKDSLKI